MDESTKTMIDTVTENQQDLGANEILNNKAPGAPLIDLSLAIDPLQDDDNVGIVAVETLTLPESISSI